MVSLVPGCGALRAARGRERRLLALDDMRWCAGRGEPV
jgi:hypothetical protein